MARIIDSHGLFLGVKMKTLKALVGLLAIPAIPLLTPVAAAPAFADDRPCYQSCRRSCDPFYPPGHPNWIACMEFCPPIQCGGAAALEGDVLDVALKVARDDAALCELWRPTQLTVQIEKGCEQDSAPPMAA